MLAGGTRRVRCPKEGKGSDFPSERSGLPPVPEPRHSAPWRSERERLDFLCSLGWLVPGRRHVVPENSDSTVYRSLQLDTLHSFNDDGPTSEGVATYATLKDGKR